MQINQILSQLHSIMNCKVALSVSNRVYMYPLPEEGSPEDSLDSMKDCRQFEIDIMDSRMVFYVENGAEVSEASMSLAALYIKSQLDGNEGINQSMSKLLSNSYSHSDVAAITLLLGEAAELQMAVISGLNAGDNRAELLEIIKNSLNVKLLTEYQGSFIAVVEEQDINEACSGLYKNIMAEIYEECIVAIGGRLEAPQQLGELYNICLEAIELKKRYGINQNVLDYEGMSVYRLVASMDESLKKSITPRIFSRRFVEMLNNEMELTIEEMFRNNLNLTDTSARLFIHRNTLLYRIDKIYKQTGFDLRKFEDSMVFKLAWLMYKEKNI